MNFGLIEVVRNFVIVVQVKCRKDKMKCKGQYNQLNQVPNWCVTLLIFILPSKLRDRKNCDFCRKK